MVEVIEITDKAFVVWSGFRRNDWLEKLTETLHSPTMDLANVSTHEFRGRRNR